MWPAEEAFAVTGACPTKFGKSEATYKADRCYVSLLRGKAGQEEIAHFGGPIWTRTDLLDCFACVVFAMPVPPAPALNMLSTHPGQHFTVCQRTEQLLQLEFLVSLELLPAQTGMNKGSEGANT